MIPAIVFAAVILSRAGGGRVTLPPSPSQLDVGPAAAFTTIAAAVRAAHTGDTIRVHAGVYAESTIVVDKPLTIVGDGSPVLDGRGQHGLILVTGDDVTVQGLVLRNVGPSFVEDRAAIRVKDARRCTIAHNHIENGFFGIYLANVTECHVIENTLHANGTREMDSGNGIHLWTSRHIEIRGNQISGHRDGI